MRLRSSNPYDHPKIIPNYATHPDDLVPIIEAFKVGEKWAQNIPEYNATIVVNDVPGCQHIKKGLLFLFRKKTNKFFNAFLCKISVVVFLHEKKHIEKQSTC